MIKHEHDGDDGNAAAFTAPPSASYLSDGAPTDDLDEFAPAPRDEARLLVQSPRRLYLYWSFARDPRATLRRAFGALCDRFEIGVRLLDSAGGGGPEIVAAPGRSLWLDAAPGRVYRAEIGFFAEGSPFVRVLASNAVETPTDSVSHLADVEESFRTDSRGFARLLAASGFAEHARAAEANVDRGAGAASFDESAPRADEITAGKARLIEASSPPLPVSPVSLRAAPSSLSLAARRP